MARIFFSISIMILPALVSAEDAAEAAASCVVTHESRDAAAPKTMTCFENIALERTSFESGVCQWKPEDAAAEDLGTTTRFVPSCPSAYSAWCDRLVLNPQMVAPVKIFIYDRTAAVLERAKSQCLGGGGKWTVNDAESK